MSDWPGSRDATSTYIIRSTGSSAGAPAKRSRTQASGRAPPSFRWNSGRVQLQPVRLVEPEELHALRVALAPALPRHLVHPAELVGEALEGELVRQPAEHLAGDQVAHHRRHAAIEVEPAIGRVPVVAAEQLVPAVAAEHHLHLARGHPREVEQAHGERVGRLVQRGDQARQVVHHGRRDFLREVAGPVARGDRGRGRQLVEVPVRDAHGEGAQLGAQRPARRRRRPGWNRARRSGTRRPARRSADGPRPSPRAARRSARAAPPRPRSTWARRRAASSAPPAACRPPRPCSGPAAARGPGGRTSPAAGRSGA